MSDHEDLLSDDLGDQSLADYNLGNDEEEQLLADDYESGASQNVPTSIPNYADAVDMVAMVSAQYPIRDMQYSQQPMQYQMPVESECVVPNIVVEVPSTPLALPEHSTYGPYEPPPVYEIEHTVPPPIPASPLESPQIVPSEMAPLMSNGDMGGPRERFMSERPPGSQRLPQIRDIPDTLDKVVVRGGYARRPRGAWRHAHFAPRYYNQYRRNNMHRGNFSYRPSFPPPQMRPSPPQMRPEMPPDIRPDIRPEIRLEHPTQMGPEISPERPILPNMPSEPFQHMDRPPFHTNVRFPFRPNMDEPRPNFRQIRPNFERPMFYHRPMFNPRPFAPPIRGIAPNSLNVPQMTIRHVLPPIPGLPPNVQNPEARMMPLQLPPNLPPGGLTGKKVLINPHFKGNFQPLVDGVPLPAYIPTRIHKSPPHSPTLESNLGPIQDIDDAAERFIAEQRDALARAANRKFVSPRSPKRFIENTTIEIENDLTMTRSCFSSSPDCSLSLLAQRRSEDDDLLRRQEEFISANRAGLRRRMRSPTPPPPGARRSRSASPRRSPERSRPRLDAGAGAGGAKPNDEEGEYRRRMREQESLRERVLRAKEARRRKNAVAHKQVQDRERERDRVDRDKDKEPAKPVERRTEPETTSEQDTRPDTTRKSPEKVEKIDVGEKLENDVVRDRSPVKKEELTEVNSTCENLTPPRSQLPAAPAPAPAPAPARAPAPAPAPAASPDRTLTPPLPVAPPKHTRKEDRKPVDSDDDLDLILDDIEGILSDDDDSGRFKQKNKKSEVPSQPKPPVDLRSKLPPKSSGADSKRTPRQKIVFQEEREREERKKREKSPSKRTIVSSSTKPDDDSENVEKKMSKSVKQKEEPSKQQVSNRRVVLQRTQQPNEKFVFTRIDVKPDPTKPNPGIFSRAVRTAIGGNDQNRIVLKRKEPQVEINSDSDIDEDKLLEEEVGIIAMVDNLPHGMTDTRMKTLAGNDVQSLILDKEERTATITFKSTGAAESFKKKFNNKMVAASRLSVSLH